MTIGELKKMQIELGLPDDTPLVIEEHNQYKNRCYAEEFRAIYTRVDDMPYNCILERWINEEDKNAKKVIVIY